MIKLNLPTSHAVPVSLLPLLPCCAPLFHFVFPAFLFFGVCDGKPPPLLPPVWHIWPNSLSSPKVERVYGALICCHHALPFTHTGKHTHTHWHTHCHTLTHIHTHSHIRTHHADTHTLEFFFCFSACSPCLLGTQLNTHTNTHTH